METRSKVSGESKPLKKATGAVKRQPGYKDMQGTGKPTRN